MTRFRIPRRRDARPKMPTTEARQAPKNCLLRVWYGNELVYGGPGATRDRYLQTHFARSTHLRVEWVAP